MQSGTFAVDVSGKLVAERGPGTSFGDLSLMYNTPRSASVKATSDAVVWALDRASFRRVLVSNAVRRRAAIYELLAASPLLGPLPPATIRALADTAIEQVRFIPPSLVMCNIESS